MKCPSCGKQVPDSATICPFCEEVLNDDFILNDSDDSEQADEPMNPGLDVNREKTGRTKHEDPLTGDFSELKDSFNAFKEKFSSLDSPGRTGAVACVIIIIGSLMAWTRQGRFSLIAGTEQGGWLTILGAAATFLFLFLGEKTRKLGAIASMVAALVSIIVVIAALSEKGTALFGLYLTLGAGAALGATGLQSFLKPGSSGKN
ncbi:MAG: hypothetical protein GXP49_15160 [Deltaproteobacteria bacterium]|nr:hypothetical protein [Deltaproteobacteria bacterium]